MDFRWLECPVIIPYLGGKFELSRKLVPMIPYHERYIEVFAGGASMFFRKTKAEFSVLNDKDNDIVNLYISVADCYDEFANYAKWLIKSRELFDTYRDEIKANKNIDIPDPKRAACYYYVIKCAFNNSCHNPISKEADWNVKMLEDLKHTRIQLDNVMIENLDFRELTTRYPPRPNDFWYMDPPYMIAGERKDYYFHSFDDKDHRDFAKMCNEISELGGNFMVSYDDRKEVKDAFKNYNILKIPVRYSGQLYNKNYKNELVITNYEPAGQESLF